MLAPGGRLILSVPYWNGVRKLGAPHLIRQGRRLRASGCQFYQFAYSRREVRGFLEAQGFRVLSFHPYDPGADAAPRAPVDRAGDTARRAASRRRGAGTGRASSRRARGGGASPRSGGSPIAASCSGCAPT